MSNKKGILVIELAAPYAVLECNREFLSMLDYSESEMQKMVGRLSDLISDEDYDDYIASLDYQLRSSAYTSDRLHFLNKQGRSFQVLVNGQTFRLKDGRKVLKCECIDISSLETAALTTEQAFSDLDIFSQSVRCGLSKHICDNSLTLIWANDYYYTLFGYTKEEYMSMHGESLISMIYPEDLSIVVNSITNLLEDKVVDITFRVNHKSQQFRWVNLVAASGQIDDNTGFPVANFVINDVTNLKYAEMKAQLEARKYEIIADISEEIPFEYEITTDIITYAPKYEAIYGRKNIYRHPARKLVDEGLISEDTVDAFVGLFEAAKTGVKVHNTEYKLKDIRGDFRWHYSTFSLITDENGEPFRAVGVLRNIDVLKQEQERLIEKAQIDAMTGLLNKGATEVLVGESLKEVQAGANDMIMLVDIDDFKNVNDTYGHLVGDEVIIEIAKTLMKYSLNDSYVGRIGGDEFLVYIKGVLDTQLVCEVAEKYAQDLRDKYPGIDGKPKVTLSIGLASTAVAIPYEDLVEKADAAVYQAKLNGKNGYVLYTDSLSRGQYHNERKENISNYDAIVIGNAIGMLSENNDVSKCIDKALHYVGDAFHTDQIAIYEYQEDSSMIKKTFEWRKEGLDIPDIMDEPVNALFWEELDKLSVTGSYHSANLKALMLSGMSRDVFAYGNEILQYKYMAGDKVIGYIDFVNCEENSMWSVEEVETYTLFAKLLRSAMLRKYEN